MSPNLLLLWRAFGVASIRMGAGSGKGGASFDDTILARHLEVVNSAGSFEGEGVSGAD